MTGKAHGGWLSRVFTALLCLGWNECGNERRGRREIAEGAEGMRGRTQKAQKLRRSRKRNTKIVWKRLEPVFMRVAGHKWLGRRMGAGCRCFCGFAWGAGLRGRTQKAQKLRRSRRRNTKIFKKLGKQHSPAFPASSQKPVIPAQAGIHGCASYDDGLPPRAFAGQVGAS